MALHALAYCERLFYLEEVEETRVADQRVHAGRTLHDAEVDKNREWQSLELSSEEWGFRGKVDFARYRDGRLVAVEHKKGRSKGDDAWESDKLQVTAYAVLLSEHFDKPVPEGRIRYHASNRTVRVSVDDAALDRLRRSVIRARELSLSLERPPVTDNENLCTKCSLAPVCLPEESRFAAVIDMTDDAASLLKPRRLFPKDDARRVLHVVDRDAQVRRAGLQLVVRNSTGEEKKYPGMDVGAIILHGSAQITSQAIHFAAGNDIAVHWISGGGWYVGGVAPPAGVQRRLRQYQALQDDKLRLRLSRRLAEAKIENQLRFIVRQSRTRNARDKVEVFLDAIRNELQQISRCKDAAALRGCEGIAARSYFSALAQLLDPSEKHMVFSGRSRRPPRDGFNAALSFGYGLLYREVMAAIIAVGLDSTFGFFHAPRTAAHPLALDLMELFRTTLWDMPLIASVNRRQWTGEHLSISKKQVWLSDEGKRLAISLFEQRKQETWKHPVLGYSLSYTRAIELEARLLEKEWSGEEGLFARMRLRG
ncbi:MAG: type I-MYXAN CRISPR-associated endonuclease Cas1 [Gemmatimonadetes bacterium]|nr:type I-MYXAN CRISPR-associated endonuclease Cas1 [Gemmatimonadota bacterium]